MVCGEALKDSHLCLEQMVESDSRRGGNQEKAPAAQEGGWCLLATSDQDRRPRIVTTSVSQPPKEMSNLASDWWMPAGTRTRMGAKVILLAQRNLIGQDLPLTKSTSTTILVGVTRSRDTAVENRNN